MPIQLRPKTYGRNARVVTVEATGFVRRLDELNRIAIPGRVLRKLGLKAGDPLAVFLGANGEIVLRRYHL